MKKRIFAVSLAIALTGCAGHDQKSKDFENALANKFCADEFFAEHEAKIKRNSDVIYTGINVGLVARSCGVYDKSNMFFDAAEESYKNDVDLQNIASKGAKTAMATLLNDNMLDYQGTLYERIMVNSYKGLNYMNLGDYDNARVEFNRALLRQDSAKDYFSKQVAQNRKKLDESQKFTDKKSIDTSSSQIMSKYDGFFNEFETTKDFVNPYATYLASIFFYLEKDYGRAADLFKEVAVIHPHNKHIQKQNTLFERSANRVSTKKAKKYIFIAYEDGFGPVKEEFKFTLPLIIDKKVITSTFAMPTLKKREASFGNININHIKTNQVVDFDSVVATEFKINLPVEITKSVASTVIKTGLNAAVAKNDSTGGLLALASSIATASATQADVRSWRGLPKTASIAMLENNGKVNIVAANGEEIFNQKVQKNKNVLIVVRSFTPYLPNQVSVIER
ncbi:MAG TPA: hypothetical protein VJY83_02430 [Thiopseudomonas sp.]|nr:hypothetical protein [Thiopseudomonas sp.]